LYEETSPFGLEMGHGQWWCGRHLWGKRDFATWRTRTVGLRGAWPLQGMGIPEGEEMYREPARLPAHPSD